VIGARGRTRVDGATLRARLGLDDTWAYFTSISSRKAKRRTGAAEAAGPRPVAAVTGTVVPARRGAEVQVQIREGSEWRTVTSTHVARAGRYRAEVAQRGTYRAVFAGDAGPSVEIR
jgi:stage II sporulation protein D